MWGVHVIVGAAWNCSSPVCPYSHADRAGPGAPAQQAVCDPQRSVSLPCQPEVEQTEAQRRVDLMGLAGSSPPLPTPCHVCCVWSRNWIYFCPGQGWLVLVSMYSLHT